MSAPQHLPFGAPLEAYDHQAHLLLEGHRAGSAEAIEILHQTLPRFLDPVVTWLPRPVSNAEIRDTPLTIDDTRLAVARGYSFRDWEALTALITDAATEGSPVRAFESAAEAVITGDQEALASLLRRDSGLVHARSTRITCHDPAVHGATLLHYAAANGVEGYRQLSPPNAVAVARMLLDAGAVPDAVAGMYGGQCSTMSMLVSSTPPAEAGVQIPLIHVLADYGADVNGAGVATAWVSPLVTALVFGFRAAAEALVARGARVVELEAAAGLGRVETCAAMLPAATPESRHRALALAAQLGHVEVVGLLVNAGEDPDRLNPDGFHSHGTPLHHAASGGHLPVVRLLVERGARLDVTDALWQATPLGWAQHSGQTDVAEYLAGVTPKK